MLKRECKRNASAKGVACDIGALDAETIQKAKDNTRVARCAIVGIRCRTRQAEARKIELNDAMARLQMLNPAVPGVE